MSHQSNASKIRYTEYTVHIQHWRSKVGTTSKMLDIPRQNSERWAMCCMPVPAAGKLLHHAPPAFTPLLTDCLTAAPFGDQEQKHIKTIQNR